MGIDLFLDRSEPAYQDTDDYSEDVRTRMQKAYQIVIDQLKVTFDRAKRRYDQRVRAVHFPLHSYVWFYCPRLTAGRGRKFKKLTDGPFRIVRILNDVNYVIQRFLVAAYKFAMWTVYFDTKENRLRSGSNTTKKTPKLHQLLRCLRIKPSQDKIQFRIQSWLQMKIRPLQFHDGDIMEEQDDFMYKQHNQPKTKTENKPSPRS